MKWLSIDSPLMQTLSKIADLMWLNILTIFCCMPIITIGASLTAMNYMTLKIVRDEETYITKGFFKSFLQNFRQATIIWLGLLIIAAILGVDYFLVMDMTNTLGTVVGLAVGAAAVLVALIALYAFPVLAKFDNTTWQTVKNAFVMSLMQFPKTLVIFFTYAVSFCILFFAFEWFPLFLFVGISGPGWVTAKMCNKLFAKLEEQIAAAQGPKEEEEERGEDERIFRDEITVDGTEEDSTR